MHYRNIDRRNVLRLSAAMALSGLASPLRAEPATNPNATDAKTRAKRIEWLRANSATIRSIDPTDANFSDLEPIAKAIGDAEIVMLGEADHGHGSTFLANCRLVQFLHEHMSFDVLAFESSMYDARKAWQDIRSGGDVRTAVRRSIFPIWSLSREAQPVFDYVGLKARSERPLELAGFDCQFFGHESSFSRRFLTADLVRFLESQGVNVGTIPEWPRFLKLLDHLIAESSRSYDRKPSMDDQCFNCRCLTH